MKGILACLATFGLVVLTATYAFVGSPTGSVRAATLDVDSPLRSAERSVVERVWPDDPNSDELVLMSIAEAALEEARCYGELTLVPELVRIDGESYRHEMFSRVMRPMKYGPFDITWSRPSIDDPTIVPGRLIYHADQPVARVVDVRFDLDRGAVDFLSHAPSTRFYFEGQAIDDQEPVWSEFKVGGDKPGAFDGPLNWAITEPLVGPSATQTQLLEEVLLEYRPEREVEELRTGVGVLRTERPHAYPLPPIRQFDVLEIVEED